MYDRHDLYRAMGKIALNAINNSMPSAILFGTVISTSPLKINIEQKMTLDSSDLVLTSLVSDFTVNMSMEHRTENTNEHNHEYKGKKQFTVHLGLSEGEKVILLRVQGGQKFIVLDRVR